MNTNKNVKNGFGICNGEEKTFEFNTSLSAFDKVQFINFVTNTVVNGENYYSTIRDMIFDFAIINMMTNIDVSSILNSDHGIDDMENFLDVTNVADIVKANADVGLMNELNDAVDKNIEYRTGIHKNPIAESLAHLFGTIEKKIEGIDTEELMKVAQLISGVQDELTADKMIEAYANSDLFKNKYEQMMNEREKHNAEIDATASAIKKTTTKRKNVAK